MLRRGTPAAGGLGVFGLGVLLGEGWVSGLGRMRGRGGELTARLLRLMTGMMVDFGCQRLPITRTIVVTMDAVGIEKLILTRLMHKIVNHSENH